MRLRKTVPRRVLVMLNRLPRPLYRWTTWCRRVFSTLLSSHRYRAVLMSSFIMACVLVLSVPIVPEKLLGIRSPEQILHTFNSQQSNSSFRDTDENLLPQPSPDETARSIFKRHVPHKFWARARPHNKFKRKKHKHHGHIHATQ